jgi:hypothetical protein
MDSPLLDEAMFTFTQEANCLNDSNIIEELEIKCRADIGIDGQGSCFYELKTECWSIDSLEDLNKLFERIQKSLFPNKENDSDKNKRQDTGKGK